MATGGPLGLANVQIGLSQRPHWCHNPSFDDANRHNPLAARNLYVACPEKSSHQSKRHQLVKSAMDETLAEAMLPPPVEP